MYYSPSGGTLQVFSEEYYHVQPFIEVIGKDIITLEVSGGLDCLWTRFINVKDGNVSEKFDNVAAYNSDKVVYLAYKDGDMKIIVQDIFDENKYYFEIIRDYAPVAVGKYMIIDVKFLDDVTLYLEYYRGKRWKKLLICKYCYSSNIAKTTKYLWDIIMYLKG
ncbi:hypothetical protein IMSAGC005_02444 [Lachnospiraceae bacterium]|nr:hypothetical protein IMSAGC005_02444 [Lachnospiraceae bacterium]